MLIVRSLSKFNPVEIERDLLKGISDAASLSDVQKQKLASQLPETALSKPVYQAPTFVTRDRTANELPIYFAAHETEIAGVDAINALPNGRKQAEGIRLFAKRMISRETGKSLMDDSKMGRANPPLSAQSQKIRELRIHAASATIDRYFKQYIQNPSEKYIQDLYDHTMTELGSSLDTGKPVTVHLIAPARGTYAADRTVNFLSVAAQREVTDTLNDLARRDGKSHLVKFTDDKQLPVISRTARSNASPIGRLVQQGHFDASQIKAGDKVIIVDDHIQAGGTILSMASSMKAAGAEVLGAISPTAHPFSKSLAMSADVEKLLDETLKTWDRQNKLFVALEKYGLSRETLTNNEAMIIIAYATDPNNQAAKAAFQKVERGFYGDSKVMEGESDSLVPVLNQSPKTVDEVIEEMAVEAAASRKVVAPDLVKDVHILDWDDFLREEKGMNYQLMHNALATMAHDYGASNAILADLDRVVSEFKGPYQDGMPKLLMGPEAFADFAIRNPGFIKDHMVSDLLKNIGKVDAALGAKLDGMTPKAKQQLSEMLRRGFNRQYQQLITPRPIKSEKVASAPVPYPDVKLTMMPGAEDLLKDLRKPENRVFLVSNRGHGDVEKEVNQLGLAHYFDEISGTPTLTKTEADGSVTVKRRLSKPDATRLEEIFSRYHNLDGADITLWGDTAKDITQIQRFRDPRAVQGAVKGVAVNPNDELFAGIKNIEFKHSSSLKAL